MSVMNDDVVYTVIQPSQANFCVLECCCERWTIEYPHGFSGLLLEWALLDHMDHCELLYRRALNAGIVPTIRRSELDDTLSGHHRVSTHYFLGLQHGVTSP